MNTKYGFWRRVRETSPGEVFEYALIAGLILVAAIAVVTTVGTKYLAYRAVQAEKAAQRQEMAEYESTIGGPWSEQQRKPTTLSAPANLPVPATAQTGN